MNQSSFSESSNLFSDSSMNEIALTGLNNESINREPNQQDKQDLFIDTQMLENYPQLLSQTIRIFQQRASNPQLRELSKQYNQLKDELTRRQMPQEFYQIQDKIHQIQKEDDNLLGQILDLDQQKNGNRLKLKLLIQIIKRQYQNQKSSFATMDGQYKKEIENIVDRLNEKTLPSVSQESEDKKSQAQFTKEKIAKKQQQKEKLQTENSQIINLSQKQTNTIQELKQKIKNHQDKRHNFYNQINIQNGEISLKREILADLVGKFIQAQSKEKEYDYGINKPTQEYVSEISSLQTGNEILKEQLQQANMIRAQKSSKLALLAMQLQQLQKQSDQLQSILNDQKKDQRLQQLKIKQMRNEQLLLKIYDNQNNLLMNQRLQSHEKAKRQQLDRLLELQGMDISSLAIKRVVVNKESEGKSQNFFTPKRLVFCVLIVWALILAFFFSKSTLVRYNCWPENLVEMPQTVVHRYQGKNRIVNGEVVNITHIEQLSGQQAFVDTQSYDKPIRILDEVIVVEPVLQPHGATWTERLKMEYS